jgi:hypothetical protein
MSGLLFILFRIINYKSSMAANQPQISTISEFDGGDVEVSRRVYTQKKFDEEFSYISKVGCRVGLEE